MNRIKSKLLSLAVILISLAVIIVLCQLWQPVFNWYINNLPVKGTDLYLTVNYLKYISKYAIIRPFGWNYFAFGGSPSAIDYPSFYLYSMLPLLNFSSLVNSVRYFAIFASFVFVVFSYLVFYKLSKNIVLAFLLALGVIYSANLYKALVFAGGIPFFVSQAFLPVVLFFVISYLQSKKTVWLYLGAMLAGLGIMGHPQPFLQIIYPSVLILLFFWNFEGKKFFNKEKFKAIFAFLGISILVGFPGIAERFFEVFFYPVVRIVTKVFNITSLNSVIPPTGTVPVKEGVDIILRGRFAEGIKDTNSVIWLLLGISLAAGFLGLVLTGKRVKILVGLVPFILIAVFFTGDLYFFSRGIDFMHGGPEAFYKILWPMPFVIGMLGAALFGVLGKFYSGIGPPFKIGSLVKIGFFVFSYSGLLYFGYLYYPKIAPQFYPKINGIVNPSSSYPDILNMKVKKSEQTDLIKSLTPSKFDLNEKNFRLYVIDATFNLWFNTYFAMPLARGYIDQPLANINDRWAIFWLDSAVSPGADYTNSALEDNWEMPTDLARNNTKFLIDWNAISLFEGNHGSSNPSLLDTYVTGPEIISEEETVSINGGIKRGVYSDPDTWVWDNKLSQSLHFFKVNPELTSPIFSATNAPAVLVIGDDSAYDDIIRLFANLNINSQKAVVVKGPKNIDDVKNDLSDFSLIILHRYDYRSENVWTSIQKYVENGGLVFIDTGTEVKEGDTKKNLNGRELGEIFPVKKTVREDLGKNWQVDSGISEINSYNFNNFMLLEFDGKPWNVSHSQADDVTEGGKVLLKLKGYPVLAEKTTGKGKLIWSGLNLPYHALRSKKYFESKFLLETVLGRLMKFNQVGKVESTVNWISPTKREISFQGARGVLFKEHAYEGWQAFAGNKALTIYKAGPTYPGFMYVRLAEGDSGKNTVVKFTYKGIFSSKIFHLISLLTLFFLFDHLALKGRLFGKLINSISSKIKLRTKSWWDKDEE